MKVGTNADHVSVTWERPSAPPVQNGDQPIGRQFLSSYGGATVVGPVSIITYPSFPPQVTEGESLTVSIVHGGSPPYTYQWFRDCEPIIGATNRVYTIERVTLDMNGASFACRVRNDFSEASSDPSATAARPRLSVVTEGNQRFLTWPSPFWDFALQTADELGVENPWSEVATGSVMNASEVRVPIPPGAGQRFFQLRKEFTNQPPSF